MASSASYPDFRSMIFSRFIMLLLFIIYEHHVISARSCFNLILILVAWNKSSRDDTLLLFYLVDLICYGLFLYLRIGIISASLGLVNGLDDPATY